LGLAVAAAPQLIEKVIEQRAATAKQCAGRTKRPVEMTKHRAQATEQRAQTTKQLEERDPKGIDILDSSKRIPGKFALSDSLLPLGEGPGMRAYGNH
jgi:hypothetical protein